jgi:hypothetical protein
LGSGEYRRSTLPDWEGRSIGSVEDAAVHLVEDETQEHSGIIARVWLEIGLDGDDKGGDRGGEQTQLYPWVSAVGLARTYETHNYKENVEFRIDLFLLPFLCSVIARSRS